MNFRQIRFSETRRALLSLTSSKHRWFSVATRGGVAVGASWRGGRVVNAAGFKEKKKTVSPVVSWRRRFKSSPLRCNSFDIEREEHRGRSYARFLARG